MPPRPAVRPAVLGRSAGTSFALPFRPSTSTSSASSAPSSTSGASSASQPTVTGARHFAASAAPRSANTSSTTPPPRAAPAAKTFKFVRPPVPPESPRFIRFPTPPQSHEVPPVLRRGHLPVPRDVFRERRIPGRAREERVPKADAAAFVASAAPRSQAEQRGEAPRTMHEAARRRMAESRRQGLADGLAGLWARRQQRSQAERARADKVASRNRRAALLKPEGRDDVLTRPSVRDATAKVTAVVRDPLRHERQAAAAARTAALAQARREARRDALMELYQAAGKFIVDEQELERRVSELFRPDYFKEEGYSYGTVNAENIWDVVGRPSSVHDMMAGITRTETKLFDSKRTELDRTTKRQKLVAEALTGGKMPV